MTEEMRTRTYEELLINRIAKAFESMDNVNAEFFDEILDEIEMLFKLKPDMYEQLMIAKRAHESIYQQNMQMSKQKVSLLEDEIAQDITLKYYQTKIDWSYRKDLLESMINILNEFKLIPFTNPEYAEIEPIDEIKSPQPQENVQPPVPQQPLPPVPQPQPKQQVPYMPPVEPSPTVEPTNAPPELPKIIDDFDLEQEAERLAREEEEIRKASQGQSQQQFQPPSAKKKSLGLFKRM